MVERDLAKLLAGLSVYRHEGVWQFSDDAGADQDERAIMRFKEREGWCSILPGGKATRAEERFAWLELAVHSDLTAVGFLAAISTALAEANIPCNAVAALHHDHIFVPEAMAERAIDVIEGLSA